LQFPSNEQYNQLFTVLLLHDVPDRGTDGHQVLQQNRHDVSKAVGMVVSRKSIHASAVAGRAAPDDTLTLRFAVEPAHTPVKHDSPA
jgi:hypothetical protein